MRVSGMTFERIAEELGYSNRGTVSRIVSEVLKTRETEDDIDLLRTTGLARLDALLASVWEGAMAGDVESVRAAFGIVVVRIRLFVLFVSKHTEKMQADWDCCQGPRLLVRHGPDDCRWAGCERHGRFDDA